MIYDIKDLTFAYRAGGRKILSDVSLTLKEGETLSVLGRNGAGKSTLFGCMLGLLKPQNGSIMLDGKELSTLKEKDIARIVGYVPQNSLSTFEYTVFEFVLMGCASRVGLLSQPGQKEHEAAERALSEMGLEEFKDRIYMELSGGERQQVTIARAIAADPKAILFDEPTAHLDFSNQLKVLRIIKKLSEKGYAVAITTHDPNHALLLGGNAAVFDGKGGVVSGSVKELVTEEKLSKIYGSDLRIRHMDEFKRDVCVYPNL